MAPKPIGRYGRPVPTSAKPMADGDVVDPNQQGPLTLGMNADAAPAAGGSSAGPDPYSSNYNVPNSSDLGTISKTNEGLSKDYLNEGTNLENQAGAYSGQYYGDYTNSRDSANNQISKLEQNPGYTPGEASQINVDYSKYDTSPDALNQRYLTSGEQGAIQGNPNAPAAAASGMSSAIYDTLGTTANKADAAIGEEGTELGANVEQEQANLGKAVDPSKLGLSSNFTSNYEMTPQQQQDIVTAAGTTVGNQYRSAESDLDRAAAAAGNTSPTAIAAAKQQLLDSSAAQSGDAMTQARIDASNAAASRLQTQEGMRLGSEQDISSREQQNATTVGNQAADAIARYGQQRQSEADTQRQAALSGVEAGGAAAISTGEYGDTQESQRAAELAGNRQQTTADVQNTQFQQGVQTGQLTSQGAQTTGNARRQDSQTAITDTQGQQQAGESGQLTSQGQVNQAFSAKTGAANQAQNNATTATADTRGQGIGDNASAGVGKFIGGLEDGGLIDGPGTIQPLGGAKIPRYNAAPLTDTGASDDNSQTAESQATAPYQNAVQQDGGGMNPVGKGIVAATGLADGGVIGNDDPMAQPNDAAAYSNPNNGVAGASSPKAGFSTRLRNAVRDQAIGRYGYTGSTDPNPLRTLAQNEVANGVGALVNRLEDGGVTELAGGASYVGKPTLALLGEHHPEMVVPLNRTASTKVPASTLKTAAGMIPRYGGIGPKGPADIHRPMKPMGGSLSAR